MQYTIICVHCLREMFFVSRWTGLRRCAWVLLRGADIGAAAHLLVSSQDTRHDIAISSVFFERFLLSADLPWSTLRLSRICCLPLCDIPVDASRWFIAEQFHLLKLAYFLHFPFPEVHFDDRRCTAILHASASFELRKSRFLQRRAAISIIEMQKSLWGVSDEDRRETCLFPGKTKTSLAGSFIFFFKNLLNLFHLG